MSSDKNTKTRKHSLLKPINIIMSALLNSAQRVSRRLNTARSLNCRHEHYLSTALADGGGQR